MPGSGFPRPQIGAADRRRKSAIHCGRSLCPSRTRTRRPQGCVAVSSSSVERRSVAEGVAASADLAAYAATIDAAGIRHRTGREARRWQDRLRLADTSGDIPARQWSTGFIATETSDDTRQEFSVRQVEPLMSNDLTAGSW